jgi:hypothetical protein
MSQKLGMHESQGGGYVGKSMDLKGSIECDPHREHWSAKAMHVACTITRPSATIIDQHSEPGMATHGRSKP